MAVTGFILGLVGLVLVYPLITGMAVVAVAMGGSPWLMYLWIVICVLAVILSAMGMSKLGKTGGKKGLAVAGLVIGIVALIWTIVCMMGVAAAATLYGETMGTLQTTLDNLQTTP